MNLTRLRYFTTVAEELHFGRAAQRLHMAQPPLSRQIRMLEEELGVALFERSTRKVELSSAGASLLPLAQKLLGEADSISRLMAQHQTGEHGLLRIGFVDSSSYAVMPQFLRSYRERWPGVTFELRAMSSESQREALPNGEIDIGIARTHGNEVGIEQRVIHTERLSVAVPSNHRLAESKRVSLAQLKGEPFISFSRVHSPALTQDLRSLIEAAGGEFEPIIEAEEYTTIVGLVASGEGIAVVPETVRTFQPPNLTYLDLEDAAAVTRLLLLARSEDPLRVVHNALALVSEQAH